MTKFSLFITARQYHSPLRSGHVSHYGNLLPSFGLVPAVELGSFTDFHKHSTPSVTMITARGAARLQTSQVAKKAMIAKCVNPACGTPFRYLRGGRLYLVDFPAAAAAMTHPDSMTNAAHFSEFFWLCEECCQSMRIVVEKSGDVILLGGSERHTVLCRKSAVSNTGIAEVFGRPGAA